MPSTQGCLSVHHSAMTVAPQSKPCHPSKLTMSLLSITHRYNANTPPHTYIIPTLCSYTYHTYTHTYMICYKYVYMKTQRTHICARTHTHTEKEREITETHTSPQLLHIHAYTNDSSACSDNSDPPAWCRSRPQLSYKTRSTS